jgi:hypothetical protein
MFSCDQANRRVVLVWRNRKKISQIINDYLYLPFFLLIILWPEPRICTIYRTQAASIWYRRHFTTMLRHSLCPHIYVQLYMTALTGTYMPHNPFMKTYQQNVYFWLVFYIWYIFSDLCTHMRGRAGIFKQSMGARNRVGIGLSYRPARLRRLAELIPWNRFMGSIKVKKFGLRKIITILPLMLGALIICWQMWSVHARTVRLHTPPLSC